MAKYTRQDYIRAAICAMEMPAIVLAIAVLAEFIGWFLVTTFPRFFLGTTSLPESFPGMFILAVIYGIFGFLVLLLLLKVYDFLSGYWQDCLQEAHAFHTKKSNGE